MTPTEGPTGKDRASRKDLPAWGLHPRTPEHQYRLWPAANYSSIKEFDSTPLHAYQHLIDPPAPTPAMELGTALHTAILEPERFSERYVRGAAGNLRSKGPREENDASAPEPTRCEVAPTATTFLAVAGLPIVDPPGPPLPAANSSRKSG